MLKVQDIMTSTVVTISPETTVRETMEALATNHLSGVPVVVRDKVVGVVSMTDILNFMVTAPQRKSVELEDNPADRYNATAQPDEDDDEIDAAALSDEVWEDWSSNSQFDESAEGDSKLVDQTTAADLMTDEIFSVRSTSSIRSAAALMQKRGIHRVLVIDDGKLLGIVSALDIARVVSEKGLPGKTGVKRDPCADKPSPWITL
jgi:CBS domain-containing protein